MPYTHISMINSMTSQATRRTALAILALTLALFCGAGPSAKRATTENDYSGNSAQLRGREALNYLKQQGVYDSLEAASVNSTITQVKNVTAFDGAASDEFGFAVAVDGDTLVVGADQGTVGANNKGNVVAFPMTITSSCPTSFMVNDLGDAVDATPGNSVCATAGGVCTLRAAIQEANAIGATCTPLTINFSVTGTINLATALPRITHPNLTITGPGANVLTVNAGNFQIFWLQGTGLFQLSNLKVTGGGGAGNASALDTDGYTTTVSNCEFDGNGGIAAITSFNNLTMTNCLVNNSSFLGVAIGGVGYLTNTTISNAGTRPLSTGGTTTLTLLNCTLANNSSGIILVARSGETHTLNLKNTILTSIAGDEIGIANLGGTGVINSMGNNLCDDATLTPTAAGDLINTQALLAPLGNYGGPTRTRALLPGSPAINAGTATGAPTTDQRGKARFGTTDIGAFESQGFALTVGNGDNQSAAVNTAFAAPLVVHVDAINSTDSEPVNGGRVTFTVPGSGASCSLATNPATISSGSASAGTATANGIAGGPYMVTATTGAGTLNFNLTNTAPQAVFTFSVASTFFNEAVGMAFFTIQRANTGVPVSVDYATGGGTATAGACAPGVDYVATSGTMNFGANEMNKTFSVTICNDTVYEANQTFNVTLSNPMGGTIGTTGTVIATIINDDAAPTVAINDLSNAEGNSGTTNFQTTFTVSGASEVAGGFTFQSADGTATAPSDYAAINTTAALPANVNRTTETLNGSLLAVTGDTIFEPNETVLLNGSSCTDCTFADNQGVATIQNDDCPTSFTVNDLGDAGDATPGNNVCETATGNGVCTLRAALQEANALTACTPFTINFSVMGTITLGSALPAIAHPNLTINGPGAANLTISGNNLYRVLEIASGSHNVNLSGLTLANGYIKAADTTAMSGTNQAPDGLGGGLYSLSTGTVNVTDCAITNNTAQGGNATGGTNAYGGEGIGAGIYLQSGTGTAKLTRCTISNNSALGGLGMGGTTQTLDGTGRGAGVFKQSGSLTVEDCTIADNITDRIPGSVLSSFTNARGAGLFNASGALAVTGSTFSGNRRPNTLTLAGAAIQNTANITWTMTNSTFSGNTGSNTIVLLAGTLTMVNCTVANNTLSTTITSAGAIFNQIGSTLNLKNTLLGNNTDGPNIKNFGTVISQGNNFDSDGTTTFTNGVNGDIVGTSVNKIDPLLSMLGNYGGLTQTQALLPGSLALNAGTSSGASATDQRGIDRVGNTDIGAFESRGFTLALAGGNNQSTPVSTAFANPLAVLVASAFSEPVNGGQVTFTPPGSGASATIANNPATITGGTATTGTVTANAIIGGPYTVAATANGATPVVNFSLTNLNSAPSFTPAVAISRQQGSPAGAAVTIGTVADAQTAAGSLVVTQIAGGTATGITVTGITNTSGTITAVVTAGCTATPGTVRFQVSDGSLTNTGDLTVNVTANTAPSLSYGNTSVSAGGSTTNSPTAATDNGSINSFAVHSQGTYTGMISVNASGLVSIGGAAPIGNHTITIRATDNCNATTDATFTLTVNNTLPTITPASTLIRQQGSNGIVATIATVGDSETPAGSLTVAATTIPTGISVTAITNANGTVSANVAADCTAPLGNSVVVLTVTDANSGTATANLTVNVIANVAPTLVYPSTSIALGGATNVNPTTATDNGSINSYSIFSVTPPMTVAPTVNTSGVVSITNAGAFGSHTIVVRATDNCGTTTDASFTLNVGCGTIAITPPTLVNGLTFVNYSQPLTATGGSGSYAFSLQSGTLPAGLSLNGNVITGTPTTAQASTFTIRATDDNGCFGDKVYTLNIGSSGLMYYPLARPVRLLDTRPGASPNACNQPNAPIAANNPHTQPARGTCEGLTIPANATTITGHITTVQSGGGSLTLYPSDAPQPNVSNSNYLVNEILNNAFTVGLGVSDGAFKLFVSSNTDVVIDVTGYYAPPATGGLYFHPLPKPIRLLETRTGFTGCQTPGAPLQTATTRTQTGVLTCDGVTIPTGAQALVGNATTTNSTGSGYLTLWPADATQPFASSSNFAAGVNRNAPFTVGLSLNGEFNIYTARTTDLVIDVMGYYSTQATDVNGQGLLFNSLGAPLRLMDTRAGQPACYQPGAPMTGGTVYTQETQIPCTNLTSAARALVGNVSALNASANGYLTFWPSNAAQPTVATSNYQPGRVFNRHFTVGLGTDNAFKRYAASTSDVIIDISGFFAP